MCDTLVALGDATADGSVILAKNSDREPNEAHQLVHFPHAHHDPGTSVVCTYVSVPQVSETYELLLSKPFWLWGCEMGANERGVAIGNEAVFTKEPYADVGLLGMDLIRLALERADTALGALRVIVDLLARYGQGGIGGYRQKSLRYHNSFLIADTSSAWVLETAGKHWAAEQVRDVRTISNGLTIGNAFDLASPGLVEHAIERGWCRSRESFHFARCYSDFFYTTFSHSRARQTRSISLLRASQGKITPKTMMDVLRDHGDSVLPDRYRPSRGSMANLCMHAANGLTRNSQTTGALVAHLTPGVQAFWVTGTSAPCTSLFKPVYLHGGPLPDHGPPALDAYDDATLWWHHERLHRATLQDYPQRHALYGEERDALEADFLAQDRELRAHLGDLDPDGGSLAQADLSQRCFDCAREATSRWIGRMSTASRRRPLPSVYRSYWSQQSREAHFELAAEDEGDAPPSHPTD